MGASRWQTFFWVELPLLKPAIVIAVVIRSMEALKLFDPVVLLTFGGPGTSTQTVAYYLWEQVWQFNKYSFGAAASMLLLYPVLGADLHRHLADDARAHAARPGAGAVSVAPASSATLAAAAGRLRRRRAVFRHAVLIGWASSSCSRSSGCSRPRSRIPASG